jgi:hypothetical protein
MSENVFFACLIVLSLALTWFSFKIRMMLVNLGAILAWLALGIYFLLSDDPTLAISSAWNQVLGFVFIVMAIAVMLMSIRSSTSHEAGRRRVDGTISVEKWESWGPTRKPSPKASSSERQAAYRMQVRESIDRGRSRSGQTSGRRTRRG